MRAVTVSPFGNRPDSSRNEPGGVPEVNLGQTIANEKETPPGANGEAVSVFAKALEFEVRWTRNRVALPTRPGPWTDKCMVYYADFTVTFTPTGFEVRKRSDFATDEILAAVIQLAAEIHHHQKPPEGSLR